MDHLQLQGDEQPDQQQQQQVCFLQHLQLRLRCVSQQLHGLLQAALLTPLHTAPVHAGRDYSAGITRDECDAVRHAEAHRHKPGGFTQLLSEEPERRADVSSCSVLGGQTLLQTRHQLLKRLHVDQICSLSLLMLSHRHRQHAASLVT